MSFQKCQKEVVTGILKAFLIDEIHSKYLYCLIIYQILDGGFKALKYLIYLQHKLNLREKKWD